MKNFYGWRAVGLAALLGATLATGCSSSKTKEGEGGDAAAADAGTDAVPVEALEQPASTDASASPSPAADAAATADLSQGQAQPQPAAEPSPAPSQQAAATPEPAPAPAPVEASNTAAPVENAQPAAPSGESESYTAQSGDTLMKIAFETYGDLYQWKKIYELNKDKIKDPNRVPKGVQLTLEKPGAPVSIARNGEKYLIKTGDTLGRISDDVYGTTRKWKKLWENNRQLIKDPNRIFAGFFLYYAITPEEKDEAEKLKGLKKSPAQLASTPAAAPAPTPAAGSEPAAAGALAGAQGSGDPTPAADPTAGSERTPAASGGGT